MCLIPQGRAVIGPLGSTICFSILQGLAGEVGTVQLSVKSVVACMPIVPLDPCLYEEPTEKRARVGETDTTCSLLKVPCDPCLDLEPD